MFSGGLTRESESHFFVFVVDDEIVSFRLAAKVIIDDLWHQQLLTLRALFEFFINWTHLVLDQGLVLLDGHPSLLELPLTFEQCGLVYERKHIVRLNVFDDARTVKRRCRNRDIRTVLRTRRVRVIATDSEPSRARRFANPELRLLSNQVFQIFTDFCLRPIPRSPRLRFSASIPPDQMVHRMQTRKRVARVEQLALVERLQVVLNVAPRQSSTAEDYGNLDAA